MKFPLQSLYTWYRSMIRNPRYRWWIVLGTLVYLLSPIDLIPDVFPILGQIDDVAIVTILVAEIYQWLTERLAAQSTRPSASKENQEPIDVQATSVD